MGRGGRKKITVGEERRAQREGERRWLVERAPLFFATKD